MIAINKSRNPYFKGRSAKTLATLLATCTFALPAAQAQGQGSIEVQIEGVRNGTGQLACALFVGAEGFPGENGKARALMFGAIDNGTGRCSFNALPAGRYAVSVIHDENSNQKMDTNLFGVPQEGYGVSNNKTYALSAPKWEESSLDLGAGQNLKLSVKLRY